MLSFPNSATYSTVTAKWEISGIWEEVFDSDMVF